MRPGCSTVQLPHTRASIHPATPSKCRVTSISSTQPAGPFVRLRPLCANCHLPFFLSRFLLAPGPGAKRPRTARFSPPSPTPARSLSTFGLRNLQRFSCGNMWRDKWRLYPDNHRTTPPSSREAGGTAAVRGPSLELHIKACLKDASWVAFGVTQDLDTRSCPMEGGCAPYLSGQPP